MAPYRGQIGSYQNRKGVVCKVTRLDRTSLGSQACRKHLANGVNISVLDENTNGKPQ